MEGEGVTNYDISRPNYGFSTLTTEFDDELMKRNIVSFEQCMIGKGATPIEARRLYDLRKNVNDERNRHNEEKYRESGPYNAAEEDGDSDDEFVFDSDDDDDVGVLARYRALRIQQFKSETEKNKTQESVSVKTISRFEWAAEVNDASCDTATAAVVVLLVSNDQQLISLEEAVEGAMATLATERSPSLRFVRIPYREAIPNWPTKNLPTIFVYRQGHLTNTVLQATVIKFHSLMRDIEEADLKH